MSTLYDLVGQFQEIYELSPDDETLSDTLESMDWTVDFENKAENYAKVIAQLKSDEEALTVEIKRLTEKRAGLQKKQVKLKETLQEAMEAVGKPKFKTPLFDFRIQKNPKSVVIQNEELLPDWLFDIKRIPNKAAIKDALNRGDVILGAILEQKEGLRIR